MQLSRALWTFSQWPCVCFRSNRGINWCVMITLIRLRWSRSTELLYLHLWSHHRTELSNMVLSGLTEIHHRGSVLSDFSDKDLATGSCSRPENCDCWESKAPSATNHPGAPAWCSSTPLCADPGYGAGQGRKGVRVSLRRDGRISASGRNTWRTSAAALFIFTS